MTEKPKASVEQYKRYLFLWEWMACMHQPIQIRTRLNSDYLHVNNQKLRHETQ